MFKDLLLLFAALLLTAPPIRAAPGDGEMGKALYRENCSPCHGESGKGDGPAAQVLPVRPADHTNGRVMNTYTDSYLFDVITKGGAAVGKSPFMPSWKGLFKEEQIKEIISYIRTLAVPAYHAKSAQGK